MPFIDPYAVHPADVDAYRARGHVLVPELARADDLAPVETAIAVATTRHTDRVAPLSERDTYGKAFLQVMNLWRKDETIAEFALAPRFASVAAQLLGVERVRIYHDQALFKERGGGYTPWHQDAMYWPLDGSRCITMWMPLIDIVPEMGGLTFASGSHESGALSEVSISDASKAHFESVIAPRGFELAAPRPMRAVMTVIYFADGLRVRRPTNPSQENDLRTWLPGLRPGDPAATPVNPRIAVC